jgi:hypothetical protein
MTKKIRVENADMSSHRIVVETWAKDPLGNGSVLVTKKELNYPCEIGEFYVHSGQYIVVKEA